MEKETVLILLLLKPMTKTSQLYTVVKMSHIILAGTKGQHIGPFMTFITLGFKNNVITDGTFITLGSKCYY